MANFLSIKQASRWASATFDYNVLLVANDKYALYPAIAARAGMRIVEQYQRPVINRVEKDRSAYSEMIFHIKEK